MAGQNWWDADEVVGGSPASSGPVYGPAPIVKPPTPPSEAELARVDIARQGAELARERFDYQREQDAAKAGKPIPGQTRDPNRVAQIKAIRENLKRLRDLSDDFLAVGKQSGKVGDWWGVGGFLGQNRANVEGSLQMVEGDLIQQQIAKLSAANGGKGVASLANSETEARRMAASVANLSPDQELGEFTIGLDRADEYYLRALASEMGLNPDDPQVLQELDGGLRVTVTDASPEQDGLTGVTTDETIYPDRPNSPLNSPQGPSGGGGGGNVIPAVQNTLAGLAQGAGGIYDLPMSVAKGINGGLQSAIASGGGSLLEMAGFDNAAQHFRGTGAQLQAANNSQMSIADLIERVSPTPEGMGPARFASQLVGGVAVPFGPKAAPRVAAPAAAARAAPNAAREVIEQGGQAGVRVMTSDVHKPRTFIGKTMRAVGERIPFAGTGGKRAAQQSERVQAVKDIARDFGVDASTDMLDEVADDLSKTRGGKIGALSAQKNAVIDGVQAPFQAPRTTAAIDAEIARLSGINAEKFAPVIRELEGFKSAVNEGKTLKQIEGNRKLLGGLFEDPALGQIKDDGQKAINAVYGPLREDMGEFIQANAGPEAFNRWQRANRELSVMAGELGDRVFKGVLNSADSTPENVARVLFSKKPSEVRRLVANLSPEGRVKAQGAIIARAMEKAGDDVSPDKFATEIDRLSKTVGVVFDGAARDRVQGLARLLQATKQAGVASAAPPTGAQNMPIVGGYAAGAIFGTAAAPVLAGIGGLARVYESAAVRNLLVGLGKTPQGSKAESHLLERIMKAVTSQAGIHGAAANDVLAQSPGHLAAQDQELN